MPKFVWCKKEERRIPAYRCLTCSESCHGDLEQDEEIRETLENLLQDGKIKELFVVKRKEEALDAPSSTNKAPATSEADKEQLFLYEDGRLKPFSPEDYTSSTLYRVVESYEVERRWVSPESSSTVVFEGKKPAKKTVPALLLRDGSGVILEGWEELESRREQLAEAREVLGVVPVKQVFVLKRK